MKDAAGNPITNATASPTRRNGQSPNDAAKAAASKAHTNASAPSPRRNVHGPALATFSRVPRILTLAALITTTALACRSSSKPDPADQLTLTLDAVPLLVKAADTLDVATIWATVLEHGDPVRDSTLVSFVASNGKIESQAWTRDGLARAIFRPGAQPGVASVVAQVRAVRDTVLLTVY